MKDIENIKIKNFCWKSMILRPSITFSHVSFSFIPTGLRWQHGALKLSVFICCYKNKPVTSIMRMSPGVAWALTSQTHCWRTHVAQKKTNWQPHHHHHWEWWHYLFILLSVTCKWLVCFSDFSFLISFSNFPVCLSLCSLFSYLYVLTL